MSNINIPDPRKRIEQVLQERVALLRELNEKGSIRFANNFSHRNFVEINPVEVPTMISQMDARHKPVMVQFADEHGSTEEVFVKPVAYRGLEAELSVLEKVKDAKNFKSLEVFGIVRLGSDQALLITRKADFFPMRSLNIQTESQMMALFDTFQGALDELHEVNFVIHNDLHDGNFGVAIDGKPYIFDWEDSFVKGLHEVSFDPRSKAHDYIKCFDGITGACMRSISKNNFEWDLGSDLAEANSDKKHHLDMLMYRRLIELRVVKSRDMIELVEIYFG